MFNYMLYDSIRSNTTNSRRRTHAHTRAHTRTHAHRHSHEMYIHLGISQMLLASQDTYYKYDTITIFNIHI